MVTEKHLNMNIGSWVNVCTDTAKAKGWGWKDGESEDPTFLSAQLMLVTSEAAEGLEDLRKGLLKTKYLEKIKVTVGDNDYYKERIHDQQYYVGGIPQYKPIGFPTELADILIRIFHIAGECNINLLKEVADKDLYNNTRSYRHGNKNL